MGDHYVKLSTTTALNRIRKDEEFDKGWKKDGIRIPFELRDLDPVHVSPLKRVLYAFFINTNKITLVRQNETHKRLTWGG